MTLNLVVKVHPVVLFQIVDAYERRQMNAPRVIGTLLGYVEKSGGGGGVVEATNAFCVPHKEYEETVEAELVYAKEMYDMMQKVNKQEGLVGWWATGNEVTSHSSVIHEYYLSKGSKSGGPPVIHLTVDTTIQMARISVKAYISVMFGTPGNKSSSGFIFTQIPVEVLPYPPETIALQLCEKTLQTGARNVVRPQDDLMQVMEATQKLKSMIEVMLCYVDEVLKEKVEPNVTVGRTLLDMVHSIPAITPQQFRDMFNSNVKDLLMVVSLTQLVQTQLELNEKLTFMTSSSLTI